MSIAKIILSVRGIILVAIQFIRPARNINGQITPADISRVVSVPDSVQVILHNACYNCHSNNTNYPWYSNIQPVAWFLVKHITEGKNELNFSEFGAYSPRRQLSKLEGIVDNVTDNTMPLKSYRMMHKDARLGQKEKTRLYNWAQHARDSLSIKN